MTRHEFEDAVMEAVKDAVEHTFAAVEVAKMLREIAHDVENGRAP